MIRTIYINGKFAAQRVTGVQRFAIEIIRALDRLLASQPIDLHFVLLVPAAATRLQLTGIEERIVPCPATSLHVWEQLALPWAARDGVLLNLTGSAPLAHPRQIASIHDVAVFEHPEAYSRAFRTWYRFLFRVMAYRALCVLTVSTFSKAAIERVLSPRHRVLVVSNAAGHLSHLGAELSDATRTAISDRPYLLAVGSANPTKNMRRLIEAFASMPEELDVILVIVGGFNAAVFAEDGVNAQTTRTISLGPVSDPELNWLYRHAESLVFPSTYEGFGIPPLEAMSCGCPVIASRAASIPEVCGDAAIYFDPYDLASITDALVKIVTNEPLRCELAAAGKLRAGHFSWPRSASLLLDAIRLI